MNFILTADGREINLDHPGLHELRPMTIAWSLSQINRFNGHAVRPYSVAEHSLFVCDILEREFNLGVHAQLAGLLHDAHECVVSDMATPAKSVIGPAWFKWEGRWEARIRADFNLHTASAVYGNAIKRADLMALATERRDLMPHNARLTPWPVLNGVAPITWVSLNDDDRRRATWEDWRDRWMDRYEELEFGRTEGLPSLSDTFTPPSFRSTAA